MLTVLCERAGHLQSMTEGLDRAQMVLYIKQRERGEKMQNLGVDAVKKLEDEAVWWKMWEEARNDESSEDERLLQTEKIHYS